MWTQTREKWGELGWGEKRDIGGRELSALFLFLQGNMIKRAPSSYPYQSLIISAKPHISSS